MRFLFLVILSISITGFSKSALVTFKSNKSFTETLKSVETFIAEKGLKLFHIIDHKENAQRAGLKMNNNTLFIFGNPKVGTPLMNSNPTFGIDLPVKVLVYSNSAGQTYISYNKPSKLSSKHSLSKKHPSIAKMSKVLGLLKISFDK